VSELLIGVNLGTSSSTGVLARPNGEVIVTAERAHELSLPKRGWAEHDAEEVWWRGFSEVCTKLLESAGGDDLAAVCVSWHWPLLSGGR
jgi:xylulokinase